MYRSFSTAIVLVLLAMTPQARAQVGDPTLRTDHPQYAGEGAFQTAADCVRFAEAAATAKGKKLTEQERALAIYNWLLTHQWHLLSPQENCVPGKAADTTKSQEDLIVFDAAKARFSYGYGLCGTVHAWNEPYWKAAGFNARRRAFPGHTNSEILYGGSWHAFDTDMAGLLFRKDGVVAGYADIIADASLATSSQAGVPHYPFAWPSDFNAMKKGWQEVAKNPDKWFAMYNGGYEAMPGIVHLRKGETFTRWFDPDHFGGPTKRRFWHNLKNGPARDWTFANNGEPWHDGQEHNARGNASYCNGEFVWEPDTKQTKFTGNGFVSTTFEHFSPYVICGDPLDDSNPMTGKATNGFVIEGDINSSDLEISVDAGQTWQKVADAKLPLDLTEYVKGNYAWKLRFWWGRRTEPVIKSLKFTTTVQINQAMYPRLKANGSEIAYRAENRFVVPRTPDLLPGDGGTPLDEAFEHIAHRTPNLAYRGRSATSRLAYETTNNKPASTVFAVVAAQPLVEVRAAIRYQVRVPPPAEHDYRMEVSTDLGKTWQTFAKAEIPTDNEHSNGWLAGSADVSQANVKEAWVRVTLYAGGHKTGLMNAQLYAIAHTDAPGPLTITYGWKENGELKTAEQVLAAGTAEKTWMIATGETIRDEFVRMSAN